MSNMSYCRFENTAKDLQDCWDNWDDNDNLNDYEARGKKKIIALAKNIAESYGEE